VKKILLTGSTGFIGSEILNFLSKKNIIYIILRKKNKKFLKNNKVKVIYFKNYNQLNKELSKIKVNTVIHCATHYIKDHKFEDIKKLSESNILLGNIILENLKKMHVKQFINFSTVWENYNAQKRNYFNLYSAYKDCFNNIINFYKKHQKKTKFFTLVISDTFGHNDKRKKLINTLKINYKNNKTTQILSKNLFLNLLNVKDICDAVDLILNKNIKPQTYVLKNKQTFSIYKIINSLNMMSEKKIKINWLSKKIVKEKIYNYKQLKKWHPNNSKIQDIIDSIRK